MNIAAAHFIVPLVLKQGKAEENKLEITIKLFTGTRVQLMHAQIKTKKLKQILMIMVVGVAVVLLACSKGEGPDLPPDESPNILFIIADDLGKDAINGYIEGSIKPNTPHIDAIRTNGLTFNIFWVNPVCTPTRASIITGKYGYRTGVKAVGEALGKSELTLQKYISDETSNQYASAIVGKWHLSGNDTSINPESYGIDYYAGLIRGAVQDYYQWQLTEDGSTSMETSYTTEVFTDLAINWVDAQSKPWFMWLAYNAPHTPFHVPPAEMHSQGNLPEYTEGTEPLPYYMAAIEAMDYQIGRFLESLAEAERQNTIIILIGDNGTPNQAAQTPYTNSTVKGTLYQGGINVPMFISGRGVSRAGTDTHLITGTDLFATISEIAGTTSAQYEDSKSFALLLGEDNTSSRGYQYSESENGGTDSWTISNGQYKLFVYSDGSEEMYDLNIDSYEQINLLDSPLTAEASNAKADLEAELSNIRN